MIVCSLKLKCRKYPFVEAEPVESTIDQTISDWTEEIRIRKEHAQDACTHVTPPAWSGSTAHYHCIDRLKILVCSVPKAGCTTALNVFKTLSKTAKTSATDGGMRRIWHLREAEYKAKYLNYTKMIFIRHPVERLVSAHRHFFSRERNVSNPMVQWQSKAVALKEKFREDNSSESMEPDVTFEEFLRNAVVSHGNHHWQTYELLCQPCKIPYDVIVKYETYERDLANVLVKYGNLSLEAAKRLIPHSNKSPGQTSAERARIYMKNIPESLLEKFYQVYKNDFDVFNYEFL